jgi:FkbM family methyltransferase
MRVFFQIGTNDGNDEFLKRVKDGKPDMVILVEPNEQKLPEIKENYKGIPNVHIYMNAIYYRSGEEVELVVPAKNGEVGTRADNGIVYLDVHFSLLPMNDWGEKSDMVKIKAKTITFDDICKNHNITHIEFLQIDTEGFDSEIIQMIDFETYKIDHLIFENWSFASDCFTRYHSEKADSLGLSGQLKAIKKLQTYKYKIIEFKDEEGGRNFLATLS